MPGYLSAMPRKSPYVLRFIVVGGSIAGLACAYALRKGGHRVLVLEQSNGEYRSSGGIRSPPNMTRVLNQWGLGPVLSKVTVKASQFTFADGETAEKMGLLVLHEKLMKALQADYLFVKHGDLLSIFYDLAIQSGVVLRYNSKVHSVDPWTATAILENGIRFSADVIIGADGYKSVVRPVVVRPEASQGTDYERVSLTLTVPTDLMRSDIELTPLTELPEWTMWLGDGFAVHGLLTGGKKEYGIVIHLPVQDLRREEHWDDHFPVEDFLSSLSPLHPRLQKLLRMADTVTPTGYVSYDPFDSWVHESGKVVLVGEAAHPTVPNGSHNASMAIEDAMTLSSLFTLPVTPAQAPLLLSAYEELRQPRCAATQVSERQMREFICLAHGPEQRARDSGLRDARSRALLDWDEADEEYLRETWEEYLNFFSYDARESVDDWWTKWGGAMRMHLREGREMQESDNLEKDEAFRYEVSTDIYREVQQLESIPELSPSWVDIQDTMDSDLCC